MRSIPGARDSPRRRRVGLPWPGPLHDAELVDRPNRFVVRVRFPDGEEADAHLPDPGRLRELLISGRRMGIRSARSPTRKTRWTATLVESPDGSSWVSLDTTVPNRLLRLALEQEAIEELAGWRLLAREVTYGASRLDFLLEEDEGRRMYLEAKSVTLVEDGVGLFPDAVTARGARHVEELMRAVGEGHQAAVLFVLQRPDAQRIVAASTIDPHFAETLARAEETGVRILGRRCRVSWRGIELAEAVPAGAR